jgi:molybdopterin/thiamine biosynthesis adenylyltransferase
MADYGIVADGCDHFGTRFLVNQTCIRHRIPLVSAAIAGWHGQVMTIAPHIAPATGCYQCFAHPDAPDATTCRESGIIGPLAGIIGSCQALEVVHCILGRPALIGKILHYDARSMTQRISHLSRDAACAVCGTRDNE